MDERYTRVMNYADSQDYNIEWVYVLVWMLYTYTRPNDEVALVFVGSILGP